MNVAKEIQSLLSRRPLVLVWFDESFTSELLGSRNGVERFTFTQRHSSIEKLKAPTLCIAQLDEREGKTSCYIGVLARRATVSTFDARLTFTNLKPIDFDSLTGIGAQLTERGYERRFYERLTDKSVVIPLSEKLGLHVIDIVSAKNNEEVKAAFRDLPDSIKLKGAAWEQKDAIHLAEAIFGLSPTERASASTQDLTGDVEDAGSHLLEDNVIAADASSVPGYSLIKKHITGRSDFRKGNERLTIYTANRGPIEEMLGVDLVYINEVVGNIVMVQYKMLEQQRGQTIPEWVFRPDKQLAAEMERMRLPEYGGTVFDDYRLHKNPFFFKFVKRKLGSDSDQAFVISLPHLKQIMENPKMAGPKGGLKVSYQALGGSYLRQSDIIGLIRSGYIGTHRIESDSIKSFLVAVNRGDRGVVLAWQRKIERSSDEE